MTTRTVRRIHTDSGTRIDPPMNPDWDNLTKLRWQAEIVNLDTSFTITVHPAKPPRYGMFELQIGGCYIGAMPYRDAERYISGVHTGSTEALRQAEHR